MKNLKTKQNQLAFRAVVPNPNTPKFQDLTLNETINLNGEEVTVEEIIPHPNVQGRLYFKFSNGKTIRDTALFLA